MVSSKSTKINGPMIKPMTPKAAKPPNTPTKMMIGWMWPCMPKIFARTTASNKIVSISKPKMAMPIAVVVSPIKKYMIAIGPQTMVGPIAGSNATKPTSIPQIKGEFTPNR